MANFARFSRPADDGALGALDLGAKEAVRRRLEALRVAPGVEHEDGVGRPHEGARRVVEARVAARVPDLGRKG